MSVDVTVHTVVATPFFLHHHLVNTTMMTTQGMGMVQGPGHIKQHVLDRMYVFSFFYLIFSSLLTTFMFITRYDNEIIYDNNDI